MQVRGKKMWRRVPGNRDFVAEVNGRHFLVHVGHGGLWYAFEQTSTGDFYASRGRPWDGPGAMDSAREWCERVAQQPRRKGRVE